MMSVKKLIDDASVISFDIFDTLICRKTLDPTDIFLLMEDDVRNILGYHFTFAKFRELAEKHAKKTSSKQDVTIDEIYNYFIDLGIDASKAEQIKQLELKTEQDNILIRKAGKELYDYAVAKGKTIVFSSDMYLPKEFLENILYDFGYSNYQEFFLSSQIGLSKSKKGLYKHMLVKLNMQNNAAAILHIGDHYKADYKRAKECGLSAYHIAKAKDIFFNNPVNNKLWQADLSNQNLCLFDRLVLNLIINRFFDNPWQDYDESLFQNSFFQAGYCAFGPFSFSLSKWLYKTSTKNNNDLFVFLLRDGYIPFKIWQKLYPNANFDKIYASRSILNTLDFAKNKTAALAQHKKVRNMDVNKFLHFYMPLNIADNVKDEINNKARFISDDFEKLAYIANKVHDKAKDELLILAENIEGYFNSIFKDYQNIGIYDSGFLGSAFSRIYANFSHINNINYIAVSSKMLVPFDKSRTEYFLAEFHESCRYSPCFNTLMIFLELILSDSGATISNIIKDGEHYKLELQQDSIQDDEKRILEIQKGIEAFVDDMLETFPNIIDHMNLSKMFIINPILNICLSSDDYSLFDNITFNNNMNTKKVSIINYYLSNHPKRNKQLEFGGKKIQKKFKPNKRGIKLYLSPQYWRYKINKIQKANMS